MGSGPREEKYSTHFKETSLESLRKRALRKKTISNESEPVHATATDDMALPEELRIQRIELEMQNEELRRAHVELYSSRARYFDLYNLAPVGYITVDDRGVILELNLRAGTLFGENRAALKGRNFRQVILADDQDVYYLSRKRLFEKGEPQVCELRMQRLNGPPFWGRLEMSLAQEAAEYVCRIVIADITERKLAEQRFEAFVRHNPAVTSIVDEEGRYVYVNPALQQYLEREAPGLIGKTFREVWPPAVAHRYERRHAACLRGEETGTETETLEIQGRERIQQVLCFPFAGANGSKLVGSIAIDVTERQRMEELRVANVRLATEKKAAEDATRAKSQFLSAMSHEIRTPLNCVIGMAGLMLQTELTEEQQGYARIFAESAESLLGLVENILDFSKIEAARLDFNEASFDLFWLIEGVLDLMSFKAQEKSIELACWYPAAAPSCFLGDPFRIRQILLNFVSNAIKFTQAGQVVVDVEAAGPIAGKCSVRISIRDTGIGIPKESLKHLFTRFLQVDPTIAGRFGGTGLGLSIVKQIVDLMGGEISVDSVEGEGSTFTFTLPLTVDAAGSLPVHDLREGLSVVIGCGPQMTHFAVAEWCRRWGLKVEQCDLAALPIHLSSAAQQGHGFDLAILEGNASDLSKAVFAIESMGAAPVPKVVLLSPDPAEVTRALRADAILTAPVRAKIFRQKLCELFPGAREQALPAPAKRSHDPLVPSSTAPWRVLVVDDNAINRKLASSLLAKLGCEVVTAEGGDEAIEKLRQEDYALVFMDCVMPGTDGFAATEAIRNLECRCATVPIVALTACATIADRDRCFAVGMNDFLTKPIRSEQLVQCLARWLPKV